MKTFEEIDKRVRAIVHDNKYYIDGTISDYLIDAINNNDSEIYNYLNDGEDPEEWELDLKSDLTSLYNFKLNHCFWDGCLFENKEDVIDFIQTVYSHDSRVNLFREKPNTIDVYENGFELVKTFSMDIDESGDVFIKD